MASGRGVLRAGRSFRCSSDQFDRARSENKPPSFEKLPPPPWYSPDQTPSLNRPYFKRGADGRIDIHDSMHADVNVRTLVATDNPGSPNLQAGLARLPVFTTFGGGAGLTQSFNRLELTAKGDVERTVYQNPLLTDGEIVSNADRQYNQYSGGFRAAYETLPGVKPFVEADIDTRRHDLPVDSFGYQRDSKGLAVQAGSTFEIYRSFTGEASLGYGRRDYEDPSFDRLAGLIGNASLVWTADALTSVKFTASSTMASRPYPGCRACSIAMPACRSIMPSAAG